MDDIERGLLLRDEEHLASVREVVGDKVRDRLRLAGPGRTMQDERLAHRGIKDRGKLRGVRRERSEEFTVLDVRAYFLGRKHLDAVVVVSAALHEMRDERMRGELVGARGEVLPHHELSEREVAERRAFLYRPLGERLHRLAEGLEDFFDVYAGIVFGKRIEPFYLHAELGLQELDERRVEFRVLVEAREDVAFANVLASEPYGHEENRRAVVLRVRAFRTPLEESDREEERVYSAFLELRLREAVELAESARRLLGRERGAERVGLLFVRSPLYRDRPVGREPVL